MGRLTTHVLDTASGLPAAGMVIDLWETGTSERLVLTVTTNSDGRVDGGLMSEGTFRTGTFMLRFHAGDYLRTQGHHLPTPAFLDIIPIAFGMAEAGRHYHVPLLVSPYGYSTYRGS